ncbi:ABC transporter ATP-binding protein [Desulfitobacterium chlororespirans]|uniref:Nickel transport system ATP-binding protein n=1 Tax=Desulfitobacterium chlororespirans DSM 11544 TaxID=1121395 RepID=A0A1M7SJU4_9FIRM|nr:ABC transporter ATP-binding protein [Desulfitobacterium chlororespirans]SHN58742.1 nickel transport system ATP-binding protein [Desulfitobacterium chlororespirans DSM 11544]
MRYDGTRYDGTKSDEAKYNNVKYDNAKSDNAKSDDAKLDDTKSGDMKSDDEPVLAVRNLSITYRHHAASVSNVSFALGKGKVLGLAGESGSGKSSVCKAILGLLTPGPAAVSGEIDFMGEELLALPYEERRRINGKEIVFIMQNPMTAFDPCMKIKHHFMETFMAHLLCSKRDALHYASAMLGRVGLGEGDRIMDSYPHMLSGGMLQRVMIALAISLNPILIIADEPTTALDAESQSTVLSLLQTVIRSYQPAMLLVSHELRVLSLLADDIAVMKDGRLIETGSTRDVFGNPQQEYTRELMAAHSLMGEAVLC